jgi:hypothetical protein
MYITDIPIPTITSTFLITNKNTPVIPGVISHTALQCPEEDALMKTYQWLSE